MVEALELREEALGPARAALVERDTLLARRTLALWRDTLAPRDGLDAALRRQAQALADSLATPR